MATKKQELYFKVLVPALLKEITDCTIGADKNGGVLYQPMNMFRIWLGKVAQRAAQLNDPILNKLMADGAMYDETDPSSKHFNQKTVDAIYANARWYIEDQKNKSKT